MLQVNRTETQLIVHRAGSHIECLDGTGRVAGDIEVGVAPYRCFGVLAVVVGECSYGIDTLGFSLFLFSGANHQRAVGKVAGLCHDVDRHAAMVRHAQRVDIPFGCIVREVYHLYISAVPFNFLSIPQREGIVVAVGEYDSVVVDRRQVVHAEVAGGVSSGTVVVVPGLRHHLQWHQQAYQHSRQHPCPVKAVAAFFGIALLLFEFAHKVAEYHAQGGYCHAYPYCKGIERPRESIIALTRLTGSLVEIQHNGYACHKEEEEYHPELLYAALGIGAVAVERLPQQTNYTQHQGQHVEYVVALVAAAIFRGQKALVA